MESCFSFSLWVRSSFAVFCTLIEFRKSCTLICLMKSPCSSQVCHLHHQQSILVVTFWALRFFHLFSTYLLPYDYFNTHLPYTYRPSYTVPRVRSYPQEGQCHSPAGKTRLIQGGYRRQRTNRYLHVRNLDTPGDLTYLKGSIISPVL